MSVELQSPHEHKQFAINSTQFEEIIPLNRKEPSSNLPLKKKEMEKASEEPADKDGEKQRKESVSKSKYSSDEHGSYDDDFEDLSDTQSPRKVQQKSKLPTRKTTSPRTQQRQMSTSSRSPEISTAKSPSIMSHRSSIKKSKKKHNTRGSYASPRSSSPASSRPPEKGFQRSKNRSAHVKLSRLDESVVDRVLSANRHKVQKLESRLSQLVKELSFERDEIKTLRQIHYRQEKELTKVNNDEAELPRLLEKHTTEVKSLRERVRQLHETTIQKQNKLNYQDKEILKLKDKCKHLKDLCDTKNLTERADLQKKLTQTETNLEKKDSEISKLQRMINLKEKTHARHLREEKEKIRETESKCKQIEENYNNLQERLKEKEKQLNYTNIYQRQIVLKEKSQSSPEVMPKMAALLAPKKPNPKTKKPNNATKNKNDNKGKTEDERELEKNKKPDSFFLTAHSDTGSSDKELDKSTGKAEDNKQEEIEANKQREKEEFERSLHEEDERLKKEKQDVERKMKEMEEREEREKAERETQWREDSARRAKEEEERRQESARCRKEEADEQTKIENEQRKTEEWIRENERRKSEEIRKNEEDNFFDDDETRTKKEKLLARLKAIDNEKDSYSDDKRSSSGKSGKETKHVEDKLLNSLPPLRIESRVVSPPMSVKSDPDGVFGIPKSKPVLIGRGSLVKKSSPFSWLDDNNKRQSGNNVKQNDVFGDYSPSMSKKKSGNLEGDMFGQKVGRRRVKAPGENGFDFGERRGSGGFDKPKSQNNLAFLSDDFGNKKKGDARSISPLNNEPLLPLRRRAQEKSGPAISSVFDDNLDNDIEELTL